MTSRERFVAASRGGELDRRPVIAWPDQTGSEMTIAYSIAELIQSVGGDRPVLIHTFNPFGLATQSGVNLNQCFDASVEEGNEQLGRYSKLVNEIMHAGLAAGADGVFYEVHGASASESTPMEFGGRYLEVDRQNLDSVSDAALNVVMIVGNDDVYLDFVSDLPAHIFAWDAPFSKINSDYLRTHRTGAQASTDANSEIELRSGIDSIADFRRTEVSNAI